MFCEVLDASNPRSARVGSLRSRGRAWVGRATEIHHLSNRAPCRSNHLTLITSLVYGCFSVSCPMQALGISAAYKDLLRWHFMGAFLATRR